MADVVIIGAGVVGAACAYYAARAGLTVTVLDAGPIAGGTTGAGEGNILVSDKEPGPELALALLSNRLWRGLDGTGPMEGAIGPTNGGIGSMDGPIGPMELEHKGGLTVAATAAGLDALTALADRQRTDGVIATAVDADALAEHEPHLAKGLAGGVYYPQDLQVQPMLATARLLKASGADVRPYHRVVGLLRGAGGRVTGVTTTAGPIAADCVINAAGTWAGTVADMAGVALPILPRRGFILVTQPLPPLVRHKVYAAEYVANVASDDAGLETSAVVEGTASGTVLIGASRERVGFDRTFSLPVLRRLAAQAIALFPVLASVQAIRAYRGFRPYCPDHLPVIGADPRAPGLYHACGHEGAGIGLAPATGHLLAALLTGVAPALDLTPFRPERFA